MLSDFVESLPGAARATLALALIRKILPVWEDGLKASPALLEGLNRLIDAGHRVVGGAEIIVPGILGEIVERIGGELEAGRNFAGNRLLRAHFATLMQPLTHHAWEETLPETLRLVFTSVCNLLAALIYRRLTTDGETHVYVAINQACDVILRESLFTTDGLNAYLQETAKTANDQVPDPLVADVNPEMEKGPGLYTGFLNSVRREYCRCPRCSSSRVTSSPVGIEFTSMHCISCGYDDSCLDVYQLDEWYC